MEEGEEEEEELEEDEVVHKVKTQWRQTNVDCKQQVSRGDYF